MLHIIKNNITHSFASYSFFEHFLHVQPYFSECVFITVVYGHGFTEKHLLRQLSIQKFLSLYHRESKMVLSFFICMTLHTHEGAGLKRHQPMNWCDFLQLSLLSDWHEREYFDLSTFVSWEIHLYDFLAVIRDQ